MASDRLVRPSRRVQLALTFCLVASCASAQERSQNTSPQQRQGQQPDANQTDSNSVTPTAASAPIVGQTQNNAGQPKGNTTNQGYDWSQWLKPEPVTNLVVGVVGLLAFAIGVATLKALQAQTRVNILAFKAARRASNAAKVSADASTVQAQFTVAQKRISDRQLEQTAESLRISRLSTEAASTAAAAAEAQAKRTATAVEESAAAARVHALVAIRTVENMDRPWLGVKVQVLQQPRLTVGKPLAIHFRVIVTNVGRSAAQHVLLSVDIVANENDIDPMGEVTRVINSIPQTNIRGQVILPDGELAREFILETPPLSHVSVTPTIFGGVRYTHGSAADGGGLPSPVYHTTTFGFRVKAKNNIGSKVANEDGSETWFWDAEVETSARDFHHAD